MTLQEIKEQYAKEKGFSTWKDYLIIAHSHGLSEDEIGYDEISKRYAKAKLEEAAENAIVLSWGQPIFSQSITVDKQSITETPLD